MMIGIRILVCMIGSSLLQIYPVLTGSFVASDGSRWDLQQRMDVNIQGLSQDTVDLIGNCLTQPMARTCTYWLLISNNLFCGFGKSRGRGTLRADMGGAVWCMDCSKAHFEYPPGKVDLARPALLLGCTVSSSWIVFVVELEACLETLMSQDLALWQPCQSCELHHPPHKAHMHSSPWPTISFRRWQHHAGFPLDLLRQVNNAFEASNNGSSLQGVYCSPNNQTTTLNHNTTLWNVFRVLPGQRSFPLTVTVQQQLSRSVVLVDAYSAGGSAPGLSVTTRIARQADMINHIQNYLVTPDHSPTFDEGTLHCYCQSLRPHIRARMLGMRSLDACKSTGYWKRLCFCRAYLKCHHPQIQSPHKDMCHSILRCAESNTYFAIVKYSLCMVLTHISSDSRFLYTLLAG